MKHFFYSTFVIACLTTTASVPAAQAKQPAVCSNATLNGTYGFYSFGVAIPNTPRVNLGRETYDGNGNFVTSLIFNQGGVVTRVGNNPGSYLVNPDCTGTSFAMLGPLALTLHFVIVDGGSQIDFLAGANPAVLAFVGVRKKLFANGDRACNNEILNGTYGFYSAGNIVPAGIERLTVGTETYDGHGMFSDHFTVNTGGALSDHDNAGSYTVNQNCFGQIVTPLGSIILTIDFIVVADAREVDFIVSSNDQSLVLWGVRTKQDTSD